MESTGGTSGSTTTAAASMPSPSVGADNSKVFCSSLFQATNYEFDPSISEEERRFYLKAYSTVDVVRERKTHCTVCKIHIGTAPVQEHGIKMHPILRVTHCNKCHDFYNSGEFSKGEDGSELYCRWCGQGGEVYCCSSCPYVFCKSCIVKNLSRGVVADIEQNENWNCFSCAPKILWPLRAQHWALMNYIEQQKKELYALNLSESELKTNLSKDRSKCCRLAKAKCGNMSDSMESLDSLASKRSHSSTFSSKKAVKHSAPSPQQIAAAKRAKSNDEVVCTPDLLSMLEPDCQITVPPKPNRPMGTPSATTPKIMSIQQPQSGFGTMTSTPKGSAPPPLVLRNTAIKLRPVAPPPVVRRTIIGPRTPNPGGNGTPVYHTINGYRIDLNSAAQQETFRLPNGKLIQVKRQGPPPGQNSSPSSNNWQHVSNPQQQRVVPQTIASRPVQITQHPYNVSVQQQQGQHPQVVRYHNNMVGNTTVNPVAHNGTTIQVLNGQMSSSAPQSASQQQQGPIRPVMIRHVFPDTAIGHARSGLQDQVFNAMEICTHLTNKVQTLTNSNAYKQARSFLEVKELYIHLSYLLTYAIGRFKSLQDKCLGDMRTLGFGNDADCLENGQLAADKQASDDEDNEIEIVEPKTDLITLDSDDDEPATSTPNKSQQSLAQIKSHPPCSSPQYNADIKIKQGMSPVPIMQQANRPGLAITPVSPAPTQSEENLDLMSMAQSFLASMLVVDVQEEPQNSPGSDSSGQKKQPRKKLTSKPNPTLLKQKALMERERMEEMKRNDQKLKMKCAVELKKAEEVFPYAKEMLEARAKGKLDVEETEENASEKEMRDLSESNGNENEVSLISLEEKSENEKSIADEEKEITEKAVKDNEEICEIKKLDIEGKVDQMETSEKETAIEIILENENSSMEEEKAEGKEEEECNSKKVEGDINDSTEYEVSLESAEENSGIDGSVEENKTDKEKLPDEMSVVESPLVTAKDESRKIEDKQSPCPKNGITPESEANKNESNALELEMDENLERNSEAQSNHDKEISKQDIKNSEEHQQKESVVAEAEHISLKPVHCDNEELTGENTSTSKLDPPEISEEKQITDKVLPSLMESLPSSEPISDKSSSLIESDGITKASSNGNNTDI